MCDHHRSKVIQQTNSFRLYATGPLHTVEKGVIILFVDLHSSPRCVIDIYTTDMADHVHADVKRDQSAP